MLGKTVGQAWWCQWQITLDNEGCREKSITGFLSPLFFSSLRLQLCVVVCGESQNSLHVYECVSLQFIDRMFLHQEKANYHFAF